MTGYPSLRILPADDRAYIAAKIASGEAETMKQLAKDLGRCRLAVAAFCKQALASFADAGKVYACPCGKPLFHPRDCVAKNPRRAKGDVRAAVVRMLLDGASYAAISQRHGLNHNQVQQISRHFDASAKATRKAAVWRRLGLHPDPAARRAASDDRRRERDRLRDKARRDAQPGTSTTPATIRDPLYQRIRATMPQAMSDSLRDDIMSEIYLAVLEGSLMPDAIEREAKRFLNAGYAAWASRFGPRSLDEPISSEDRRTRGEMIPDPSALAAFDNVEFEREWA